MVEGSCMVTGRWFRPRGCVARPWSNRRDENMGGRGFRFEKFVFVQICVEKIEYDVSIDYGFVLSGAAFPIRNFRLSL